MATVKELNQEIGDLEETINEATAILEDAYTPEASREDLAEAIGTAEVTDRRYDIEPLRAHRQARVFVRSAAHPALLK